MESICLLGVMAETEFSCRGDFNLSWPAVGIEPGRPKRAGACVRETGRATLGAPAWPLHASPRTADYRRKPGNRPPKNLSFLQYDAFNFSEIVFEQRQIVHSRGQVADVGAEIAAALDVPGLHHPTAQVEQIQAAALQISPI